MQIISQRVYVQVVSTGGDGVLVLAQREYSTLTYRSLQPQNDFADRGVDQLPKYFYREHGLMVWEAIHKYRTHTRQNVYTRKNVLLCYFCMRYGQVLFPYIMNYRLCTVPVCADNY